MQKNLFRLLITVAVVSLTVFLPAGDRDYLYTQTLGPLTDHLLEWLAEQPGLDDIGAIDLVVYDDRLSGTRTPVQLVPDTAEPEFHDLLVERLGAFGEQHGASINWTGSDSLAILSLTFRREDSAGRLTASWKPPAGASARVELAQPFFRPLALLPPLLAIVLALTFRQTLLALFAGVWIGATIVPWFQGAATMAVYGAGMAVTQPATPVLHGTSGFPNPLLGLWRFLSDYFWARSLMDTFRIEIIGFVAVLIAAVGVMTRGGAIAGMVAVIVRFARTVRTTRLATALMGLIIFFDDYTNSIVVGNTMRPLTDRMKISREKLAYLVDSTAAPVAGIMVLSTWVAYEVSQFEPQLRVLGIDADPYGIFIRTIPYRFYCLFTLFFVFASTLLCRDFGPMLTAERRAGVTGKVLRDGGKPLVSARATNIAPRADAPERWLNAVIPLMMVMAVTIIEIIRLGAAAMEGPVDLKDLATLREVLGNTDTVKALFHGSIAGWVLAVVLLTGQRILTIGDCIVASIRGAGGVVFALAILFLAWSIGEVCADLGTAHVLIAMFKGNLSPYALPIVLFLLSCAVSFSTGSSWSTMAIILPNTVMLAYAVGESFPAGPLQLTILSIGAVLEGSIFGDHCSPLSDTTILSSVASASDHVDHVRTQMPYAITTMLVAIGVGYVPAVLGLHPAVSFLAGAAVLIGLLFFIGKNPDLGRRPDTT